MNQAEKKKPKEFIDFGELFLYYVRYWKWFLLSIILCFGLTYIYLKITPVIYNTTSNILIKTEDSRSASMSSAAVKSLGFGGLSSSESTEDEVQVLSSYTLMKKMVSELELYKTYALKKFPVDRNLYKSSPITVNVEGEILDTLAGVSFDVKVEGKVAVIKAKYGKNKLGEYTISKFPETIKTDVGSFTFEKNDSIATKDSYGLKINVSGLNYMAESYMSRVSIAPNSKKSSIIGLSVLDQNSQRAQDVLNKVVKLYNIDALDDKNKMAQNTASFIENRISFISKDLGSIESEIESYKNKNNIVDIGAETGMTLSLMSSIQQKTIELEIELSLIKMVEDYLSDPRNKHALIPMNSGMPGGLGSALGEYNAVVLERARLLRNTSETNPVIVAVDEQLEMLKKNVDLSIRNVRKGIDITKKDWADKERLLQAKASSVPRQEKEFIEIKRQQQIKAELYIFLLQKLQEAELTLASSTPKAKIVDKAYTKGKPVAPRRTVMLAFGLLMGLMIPVVVVWVKDLFKLKLSDINELERNTSIPILGEISRDKSGKKIVVSESTTTSTAELFRLIRTNLQFILTRKEEKVVLITSSVSGEGKSFFGINFALSLSLIKDKKVVLVGLDIRNPKITEYLSLNEKRGVTTYLSSDDCAPEDVIIKVPALHPNLSIVPAGPIPPNPSELLLSDRLDGFFEYLREHYDYIIVDTAPIGMVSDTFTLARISDATIYLYRANHTNKSYLKLIENVVNDERLKKVSLVMNGTTTKSGYGYGYGSKK